LLKRGLWDPLASGGAIDGPPRFCLIVRKGQCGKEAFLLKAFLVTFVATKVTRPSRGYERDGVLIEPQTSLCHPRVK
jgi:hypothetical protein